MEIAIEESTLKVFVQVNGKGLPEEHEDSRLLNTQRLRVFKIGFPAYATE